MDDLLQSFTKSLQTGYVDKSILSNQDYQPELLVNQKIPPKKVLSTILHEFDNCNQFFISVAFVTTSGVATIINKLKELEDREIKGKILVSQYLNFTQPEALKRLLQFKNIDLRISTTGNAHTKGYIFKNKRHYNLIVGSSNLTAQALSTNKEWIFNTAGNLTAPGAITASGKIGYANGGTATQTGTGQGVTLNQLTGQITLAKSSWNVGDTEIFNISCNKIANADYVMAQVINGSEASYFNTVAYPFTAVANSIRVQVTAVVASTATPVVQYLIMKAATS